MAIIRILWKQMNSETHEKKTEHSKNNNKNQPKIRDKF